MYVLCLQAHVWVVRCFELAVTCCVVLCCCVDGRATSACTVVHVRSSKPTKRRRRMCAALCAVLPFAVVACRVVENQLR